MNNYELYIPPLMDYDLKTGRFLKGHKSWNKGRDCSGIGLGGNTKFSKGHKPHNTEHDGCITKRWHKKDKDYYTYIRTGLAKWQLYQRYIWEQTHGKIPEGFIIRFRNGNKENFDINNLECISRAENLKRNRNREKAAESMRRSWRVEKIREIYGIPRKTKLRIKNA